MRQFSFWIIGLLFFVLAVNAEEAQGPGTESASPAPSQPAPSEPASPEPAPSEPTPPAAAKEAETPQAPKAPAAKEEPARPGPEKSIFQVTIPKTPQPAPSKEKPAQEEPRKEAEARTPVKTPTPAAPGASSLEVEKLQEELHNHQYRLKLVLQQLMEERTQKGTARREAVIKGEMSEIDARIDELKQGLDLLNPAIHDAFPGSEPEVILERADQYFVLGDYTKALQQYYSVRDQPARGRSQAEGALDDADRAWALFQIGQCEKLLGRIDSANLRWGEVNKYFTPDKGFPEVQYIEEKFSSFTEDPQAVRGWSTGFWRRQAKQALEIFDQQDEMLEVLKEIRETMDKMRQRAGNYFPEYTSLPAAEPASEDGNPSARSGKKTARSK